MHRAQTAALLLIASLLLTAHAASGQQPQRPLAPSYLTGIGDEQPEMFGDPLWRQLRTQIARYVAPYDSAVRPDELAKARAWISAAEAQHQQVLVAFYHSRHTPTMLPSVANYRADVTRFIAAFPRVRQYQAWDESNRGQIKNLLASPSASATARYYQALARACRGCTVIGLDVLDQANPTSALRYITEFKHEVVRLRSVMPTIWGLHNYSDINRLESWRTRELIHAFGGQVWLTETGGLVQFPPLFPNRHGAGLARASRALRYMFGLAAEFPQIKRIYIFDWTGGSKNSRFDAGLTDDHDRPRPGYLVVCKQLHAARCNMPASRR